MPSAADQAGSLPAGRTLDHAGVVALRWHHRPAFRAMGVTGGPSTVGHGEDFQGVAVGVVPLESPALVGARFVDSLSLVARVGVRRDAMVNSLAWRQVSGMSAAVSDAERSLSRCQRGPGLGAPCSANLDSGSDRPRPPRAGAGTSLRCVVRVVTYAEPVDTSSRQAIARPRQSLRYRAVGGEVP